MTAPSLPTTPLLTVRQVADILTLSESTVKALARSGKLAAYRTGGCWRFDSADVRAYLASVWTGWPTSTGADEIDLDVPLPKGFKPVDFEALLRKQARR
jgi:excisionase family DNA binding protein